MSGTQTSTKKRYKLEYDWQFPMVIEVDHAVLTDQIFKDECSSFWSGKPDFKEWLGMIYMVALRESIASISALQRLREGREEGFPKMDGSYGITIVSFEDFSFDECEIECNEIPVP